MKMYLSLIAAAALSLAACGDNKPAAPAVAPAPAASEALLLHLKLRQLHRKLPLRHLKPLLLLRLKLCLLHQPLLKPLRQLLWQANVLLRLPATTQ